VRCRYYRTCRGYLSSSREAFEFASVCEDCREAAAQRRAGENEGGGWLDALVV
jgi:hypothetical protein